MDQLKNRAHLLGGSGPRLGTGVTTEMFFDRARVIEAMDKRTRQMLGRAGGLTRKTARRSMRSAPMTRHAPPGRPPFRHRRTPEHPSGMGLYRSILYGYDPRSQATLVGPSVAFGRNIANVAATLEHGGTVRRDNPRRTKRRAGGAGEVRVAYSRRAGQSRTTKPTTVTRKGRRRTAYVTYARLHSSAQAERANRLNEELYGPETIAGMVEPRPFMGPALAEVAPQMPRLYPD